MEPRKSEDFWGVESTEPQERKSQGPVYVSTLPNQKWVSLLLAHTLPIAQAALLHSPNKAPTMCQVHKGYIDKQDPNLVRVSLIPD